MAGRVDHGEELITRPPSMGFWLNLQARYDLEIEKDRLGPALDNIRPMKAAS